MWSATVLNTQLTTKDNLGQLSVTVHLDNEQGTAIDATIILNGTEGRQQLKQKIQSITDGIDNLNAVQSDLKTTPQVDTSPTIVTDIQSQLNTELNILNQIQNLVKLGKIAPDDNVVTDQIAKFAEIANKIIKPSSSSINVI